MDEKACYEKAIDGYQFLVNRYHIWMNYYSIFTGAFFIALYTVWDKAETVKCVCCKCCETAASTPDIFLLYLLIFLGWFSSVCWLASLIGHRAWMGSWLRIVKKWEARILGNTKFVYQKIELGSTESVRKMPCCSKKAVAGYISTQKITQIFVLFIIQAWQLTGFYLLSDKNLNEGMFVVSLVLEIIFISLLRYGISRLYSDDLTEMI